MILGQVGLFFGLGLSGMTAGVVGWSGSDCWLHGRQHMAWPRLGPSAGSGVTADAASAEGSAAGGDVKAGRQLDFQGLVTRLVPGIGGGVALSAWTCGLWHTD